MSWDGYTTWDGGVVWAVGEGETPTALQGGADVLVLTDLGGSAQFQALLQGGSDRVVLTDLGGAAQFQALLQGGSDRVVLTDLGGSAQFFATLAGGSDLVVLTDLGGSAQFQALLQGGSDVLVLTDLGGSADFLRMLSGSTDVLVVTDRGAALLEAYTTTLRVVVPLAVPYPSARRSWTTSSNQPAAVGPLMPGEVRWVEFVATGQITEGSAEVAVEEGSALSFSSPSTWEMEYAGDRVRLLVPHQGVSGVAAVVVRVETLQGDVEAIYGFVHCA